MNRQEIFNQIETERIYQDNKWGHNFDDKNTINDWAIYINHQLSIATQMNLSKDDQRSSLIKAASVIVAAIETVDRNSKFASRHYES